MRAKIKKYRKAWAVVSKGRIVTHDENAMGKAFLIFPYKYQAEGMVWKPGEKVARITIRNDAL